MYSPSRTWLVAALLVAASCSSDSTGPESSSAGRYVLESVNGDPLPFVLLQVLDDKLELTAGYVQLNDDTTCSKSLTLSVTDSGNVTTDTAIGTCTWSQNGTAISFTNSDGSTDAASLSENTTLTVVLDSAVLLFVK